MIEEEELLRSCLGCIKKFRQTSATIKQGPGEVMEKLVVQEEKALEAARNSGGLTQADRIRRQRTISFLQELAVKIKAEEDAEAAFKK